MIIRGTADNRIGPADRRGWEFVGNWRGSSGVAIGPRHFLTAAHAGDVDGGLFIMNHTAYRAVEGSIVGPDLRVVKVDGILPAWTGIYTAGDELGKTVSLVGFGAVRGEAVRSGDVHNGWEWDVAGRAKSWGMNVVHEVVEKDVDGNKMWCLQMRFGYACGELTGAYGAYDSGGGTFICAGGKWLVAGINTSVDPSYKRQGQDKEFRAAIWDGRGLEPEQGLVSIAVRVSQYAEAITQVTRDQ